MAGATASRLYSWHGSLQHCASLGRRMQATGLINRCRGLLLEFGYPIVRSTAAFQRGLKTCEQEDVLPSNLRRLLAQIKAQLQQLDQQLALCDREIAQSARDDEAAKRLHDFKNGRQFAAWIGLTPRQYSSGGKTKLGRISRRGDAYLRSLLVQGTRATLQATLKKAPDKLNRMQQWVIRL